MSVLKVFNSDEDMTPVDEVIRKILYKSLPNITDTEAIIDKILATRSLGEI